MATAPMSATGCTCPIIATALMNVIERGRVGETYNVGGGNERNNRDVVGLICDALDRAFAADPNLASRFPSCPGGHGRLLPPADHAS